MALSGKMAGNKAFALVFTSNYLVIESWKAKFAGAHTSMENITPD